MPRHERVILQLATNNSILVTKYALLVTAKTKQLLFSIHLGSLFSKLSEFLDSLNRNIPRIGKAEGIADEYDDLCNLPVSYTHLTLPTTPYV